MAVREKADTTEQARGILCDVAASHPDLDGVDLRVFLFLLPRLNFESFTQIRQIEISLVVKRLQPHIARSLRKLLETGLLVVSEKGTRSSEWKLNANYADENHGGG